MSLPADEIHTLVHFISPGDSVDIVSSTFERSGDQLVSSLIAENIVVLGVGRQLEGGIDISDTGGFPISVTLLVDPENALGILRASQTGALHFLARGSSPFPGSYDQNNRTATVEKFSGKKP